MTFDPVRLQAEWLALPDLGAGNLRALEGIVTRKAIAVAGGMARCRIRRIGRTWVPNPNGTVAPILPVWLDGAPSTYNAVEAPVLSDMLALDFADEGVWHYRVGAPGAVLGAERLELAHTETIPVTLFLSPFAWLRAECEGAVLLDYCENAWQTGSSLAQTEATEKWWRAAS